MSRSVIPFPTKSPPPPLSRWRRWRDQLDEWGWLVGPWNLAATAGLVGLGLGLVFGYLGR